VYSTTLEELGFYLDPTMIEELANRIPSVVGVKEGSGNVTTFLSLTARLGDRLAIGTPFEEYWALALQAYPERAAPFLMGSSRAMYMQTRDRPYLYQALELIKQGNLADAFRQLTEVEPIVALQMASFRRGVHPIALVKYACSLLGQIGIEVRPPTPALSAPEKEAVRQLYARLGFK
jgi:dihydrodipicolinate synthase/N-acetylneuraminate lyase